MPYVPGFAIEVDCVMALWLAAGVLWFRTIGRMGVRAGSAWIGLWWALVLTGELLEATAPWFTPFSNPWLTGAEAVLQGGARAAAAAALLAVAVSGWAQTTQAVVAIAAAWAVGWIGPAGSSAWVDGIWTAVCFTIRLVLLGRKDRRHREAAVAVVSGLLVAAGVALDVEPAGALWPGFLEPPGLVQWHDLLGAMLFACGGLLGWAAEQIWTGGVFRWRTVVLVGSIGVAAIGAVAIGDWHLRWRLAQDIGRRLQWVGHDLSVDDLQALYTRAAGAGSPQHRRLWQQMVRLREAEGRAMYVYLMAARDGRWFFLGGATKQWSDAFALVHQDFRAVVPTDAWVLPPDRFVFIPPARDDSGLVVSAITPVWRGAGVDRIHLGIDYSATLWAAELMRMRTPSLALLVAGGACGILWLGARRRSVRLEAAERAAATVSHELRTPLQTILGSAELLVRGEGGTEARRHLERILTEGRHLAHLIRQMLNLSAIRSGVFELRPGATWVMRAVGEALETVAAEAARRGLELRREYAEDLPVVIWTDGAWFRQILSNLISNAVRYTEQGSVVLRLLKRSGSELVIEVEDTGIGMSEDEVERAFRPFARGPRASGLAPDGAGLGLVITRQMVEHLGGTISVRSRPGVGSLFRVTMPLQPAPIEPEPPGGEVVALNGLNLLIVEDHPAVAEVFCGYAVAAGARATVARTLAEAQAWLEASPLPEVMLLDQGLPDGNGFDLAGVPRVREGGDVWCIAVSANDNLAVRAVAAEKGCDAFLAKPCGLNEWVTAIVECPWLVERLASVEDRTQSGTRWSVPDLERLAAVWNLEMTTALSDGSLEATDPEAVARRAHHLKNGAIFLGGDHTAVVNCLSAIEAAARTDGPLEGLRVRLEEALRRLGSHPGSRISPAPQEIQSAARKP